MSFEHYVTADGKRMRCGYTTGTCAALAAAGAARLLLSGEVPQTVELLTPKGILVRVPLDECRMEGEAAVAAVKKDAGDDIDVTDGMPVCARVERIPEGIVIDGGEGVGRVTKPGLDQPVGNAAINSVPRIMIRRAAEAVCEQLGYSGGLSITIFAPRGEELAKKTFNPQIGIVGGLSILGTSGIVEPMSRQPLIDTNAVENRQAAAEGDGRLILTPGNYGEDFLEAQGWHELGVPVVKCSNFIGAALDEAAVQGFKQVLLIGHSGKLFKLAGGIMDTHSRTADCRTELICAHAAIAGADTEVCREIFRAATTDAAIEILDRAGLREQVVESLIGAVDHHLTRRAGESFEIGAIIFSNVYGLLGMTEKGRELLENWKDRK
ncbi:MAG: cobalamin biosynthesis protein CbiD [Eubacterium sp.]|nr:cobalamin biosynthesis protein CbiD [Eubacterium sp.]